MEIGSGSPNVSMFIFAFIVEPLPSLKMLALIEFLCIG